MRLAIVVLVASCAVAIAGCHQAKIGATPRSQASAPPPASLPASPQIIPDESPLDMLTAFKAAFHAVAPASVDVSDATGYPQSSDGTPPGVTALQFEPAKLFEISPGLFVLISKGTNPGACHACAGGLLAVHYLKKDGTSFEVLTKSPPLGPRGAFGAAPDFAIRTDLFPAPAPALVVTAGDGGMGCDFTNAEVYELAPAGVKEVVDGGIQLEGSYDDETDRSHDFKFSGVIVPAKADLTGAHELPPVSVVYTGSVKGRVNYSDGFAANLPKFPGCWTNIERLGLRLSSDLERSLARYNLAGFADNFSVLQRHRKGRGT